VSQFDFLCAHTQPQNDELKITNNTMMIVIITYNIHFIVYEPGRGHVCDGNNVSLIT
jgi:hypothetical protein